MSDWPLVCTLYNTVPVGGLDQETLILDEDTTEPVIAKALALGVDVVIGWTLTGRSIAKLLVTKLGLSVGVTSLGKGDIASISNSSPIPAVVIYGALNKLWFHSAETTGVKVIESEPVKTEELTLPSIRSP